MIKRTAQKQNEKLGVLYTIYFCFSFHSNLLSCMNGKDKQQVYGCIRVHLVYGNSFSGNFHEMMSAQSVKLTMRK